MICLVFQITHNVYDVMIAFKHGKYVLFHCPELGHNKKCWDKDLVSTYINPHNPGYFWADLELQTNNKIASQKRSIGT